MSILLALAAAAATHSVTVQHHGQPIAATYTARIDVRSKTVGAKTPNRMDMQRCRWSATIMVDRKLDHGPALARTIATEIAASPKQVSAAVELLDGGATVPFVARYRKEVTGGLDDTQLRTLEERYCGVVGYARNIGMSEEQIEALREAMVE